MNQVQHHILFLLSNTTETGFYLPRYRIKNALDQTSMIRVEMIIHLFLFLIDVVNLNKFMNKDFWVHLNRPNLVIAKHLPVYRPAR